ncbi:alpha/beta hydrolase domain-containing protein [Patulibacter sp.]|uniref:alpha/beta hydrolase domain-containing protein n=1 Tax=Patulibacter sp. TaxID=1912859 RepID=UPI002720A3B6|nr:alpha/beta hydrolase domain-containing protein [Patulibacter sp.]MDO9406890.1 alpha/beta hydrolase domain-containing protein [Patulibacter sp.]
MPHPRRTSTIATAALAAGVLALAVPTAHAAPSDVPTPTVSGPIPVTATSRPFLSSDLDLAARGYVEREYELSGGAVRYAAPTGTATSAPAADGPGANGTYPYKTRMVVRRPLDPAKFNGTTIVEWQNVTAGFDIEWNWFNDPEYLMSKGYAWVGVSAQRTGINALKGWNPARYGTLDAGAGNVDVSYDIFSQAAKAVRGSYSGRDPLGGLETQTVIASGESQSGSRLNSYYNGIQATAQLVDGFFITVSGPPAGGLRTDLPNKVMRLLSEREVTARPAAPEVDSPTLRRWEVAGGSHLPEVAYRNWAPSATRDLGPQTVECQRPPLSKVQWPYVANRALESLVGWQKGGAAPASAPRSEYDGAAAGSPLLRDAAGNAAGGIRLPAVDVPVGQESSINAARAGATTPFSAFCGLLGSSVPFEFPALEARYADFGAYVDQVDAKADALTPSGFLDAAGIARLKTDARRFTRLRPTAPALTTGSTPANAGTFGLRWRGPDPDRTDTTFELQRRSASDAGWVPVPGAGAVDALTTSFTAGSPAPEGTYAFRLRSTTDTEATPVEASRRETTSFSEPLTGVVVDRTAPPAPDLVVDRLPESGVGGGWYRDRVSVTPTAVADPALADGSAGSGVDPATVPAATVRSSSGAFEVAGATADRVGNASPVARRTVQVDADAPLVAVSCPSGVFVGEAAAATVSAADGESGLRDAVAPTAAVDTSTPGVRTTTVAVADNVGHTASASCTTLVRALPAPGAPGAQGPAGPAGPAGPTGSRGPTGASGTKARDARVRCTAKGSRRVTVTCRVTLTKKAKARIVVLRGSKVLARASRGSRRTFDVRVPGARRGGRYTVLVHVSGRPTQALDAKV